MTPIISMHCKCGAGIGAPIFAYRRLDAFTALHNHCITSTSDDDIEEPGGDVFTSAERAPQHSQHELQIGFQREEW